MVAYIHAHTHAYDCARVLACLRVGKNRVSWASAASCTTGAAAVGVPSSVLTRPGAVEWTAVLKGDMEQLLILQKCQLQESAMTWVFRILY